MEKELFKNKKEECYNVKYLSKEYWQLRAEFLEKSHDETLKEIDRIQFYALWNFLKNKNN